MPGTAFSAANWSGYDEQAVTNPGSALTDFTLLIDVSTLSSSWKAAVQSDGADIRLTKGDGTTELAYDLIDWAYNAGAPTGWLRVLYSGTLAASGTQNVRVWAGYTGGTAIAYGVSETYGQYNAYDSYWGGYWPLDEDPSGGVAADRTSNGRDWTPAGMGSDSVDSGKVGGGWLFDSDSKVGTFSEADVVPSSDPLTVIAWLYPVGASTDPQAVAFDVQTEGFSFVLGGQDASGGTVLRMASGSYNDDPYLRIKCVNYTLDEWNHAVVVYDGVSPSALSSFKHYLDGTSRTVSTQNTASRSYGNSLGQSDTDARNWLGNIDELQLHHTDRSADWIAEEYAQSNNQSTFWGTWAWTGAGTPTPSRSMSFMCA